MTATDLEYMACEISWGSRWINLNDHLSYTIAGDTTLGSTSTTWRKITAQSPILGGTYLIHAVPELISETVAVWVNGDSQTELSDNLFTLMDLFSQYDYRLRWTYNEYREYWRCQLAEAMLSRGQVWAHSTMAKAQFTVPRWPDVTRESLE